ncbi:MAG TPA: hypothetical protein VF260_02120 [Bacilli bacterium]
MTEMTSRPIEEGAVVVTEHAERVVYRPIHVRQSTFRGGLESPVHRWFRLTPSFGPDLVDEMLAAMETKPHHTVLDPFAGAGTTLYQAKFRGLRSFGFEINPFLAFVCRTATNLQVNPDKLRKTFLAIAEIFHKRRTELKNAEVGEIGIPLPPIHNVFRWWRKDVLKDLLILRETIRVQARTQETRDFFTLALAGVLVPDLSNVTLGRLQLHFIDRSADAIDVWGSFSRHAKQMIADLEQLAAQAVQTPATLFHTDATQLTGVHIPAPIDRVVTSPPYPNRYSYVWNTRPFLYFFGFMENKSEAAELDKRTIGGTWGTATSILAKGRVEPAHPAVAAVVSPLAKQIGEIDPLMANYVMKYFNLLAAQIIAQDKLLAHDARLAYVVGCSRIKGVYVETDRLVGDLFEQLGLGCATEKIERFRFRNSGKDLYESIVYVRK